LDIGKLAGLITQEEEDFYKRVDSLSREEYDSLSEEDKKTFKAIKKKRGTSKTVNFSATYGAGAAKIAITAKCDVPFAQKLHSIYWQRNSAVKKTANACVVRKIRGQKWLYNPVANLWMFLKADKDRFSTLNQSTGVFVFDSWLRRVRQNLKPYGIKILMQYHDEIMLILPKGYEDVVEAVLRKSMQEVNDQIRLNVEIGISVDFGNNYADCH
jgi:DNA polymerase I-like protein with 3'-5' exonuclease and polymerase domains